MNDTRSFGQILRDFAADESGASQPVAGVIGSLIATAQSTCEQGLAWTSKTCSQALDRLTDMIDPQ